MEDARVVIDTNVLFAGLYSSRGASHQVLRLIAAEIITPIISVALLFEYEDVLKRESTFLQLSPEKIDVILDNLCALGIFQKVYFLWRPYLKDPKDDHILELAVASRTHWIVTHNLKDFAGSQVFGVRAIPPRQLLEMLK